MPRITTRNGVQLNFKEWGEGRPVILLHGWPLSGDSFDYQTHALAEAGFRAIAYDRRGFGRSDQPGNGFNYDTLADDLSDVIEALDIGNDIALVGFSMGGGEVARYMSRHGGKGVSQAALIASVVPYMLQTDDNPDGTPQETFDEITQGLLEDRAYFYSTFFKQFYGVGIFDRAVSQEVVDHSRNTAMLAGLNATLACAKAFATTDFRPDLAHFKVPTLIMHGTDDVTVPIDASARAAAKGIANARLIEFDGAPHGLLETNKEEVTSELISFLKQGR